MGVLVATGAIEIVPVVLNGNLWLRGHQRLVAIAADEGSVRSHERETALLMLGKLERRRLKSVLGVAVLAAVEVGRSRELFLVGVGVAVLALPVREAIQRYFLRDSVTLFAYNALVLADQLVVDLLMQGHGKRRGLESFFIVAGTALTFVWTRAKLSVVRIVGLVAVEAQSVRNGLFEIRGLVALRAGRILVLAEQRELGAGMVEAGQALLDALPPISRMAGLAGAGEGAPMGIFVAIAAGLKSEARILGVWFWSLDRRVAILALHFLMKPRQRVVALAVIEAQRRLPAVKGMAAQALCC